MTKKDRIAELRRLIPWLTNVGDIILYKGDIVGTIQCKMPSRLLTQKGFLSYLELAKGLVAGYYDIVRADKDEEWGLHALAMLNRQLINE